MLPAPVIGLVPGDPLLSIWVRRHLLRLSGIGEDGSGASIDTRTGEEMAHFRIVARIRERPLFGSKRLLWITRSDRIDEIDPADLIKRNATSATILILEGPEKVLSTWSKILPVYQLSAPAKAPDRETWYAFLAERHGLTLHKSAFEPILTTFEGSLGPVDRIFHEISRMLPDPSTKKDREVTESVLSTHGITSHYKTVFELIRGLENGDKRFFSEWERFMEGETSPFGVIAMLLRQWKLYRIAKRSSSEAEVATIGKVPAFIAGSIFRTARRLSDETVRHGIEALCEADLLLKSGLQKGGAALILDRLAATLFLHMKPPQGLAQRSAKTPPAGDRTSGRRAT